MDPVDRAVTALTFTLDDRLAGEMRADARRDKQPEAQRGDGDLLLPAEVPLEQHGGLEQRLDAEILAERG